MIFGRRRLRGSEFDDYYSDEREYRDNRDEGKRIQGRLWIHLLVLGLIGVLFLGAVWTVAGRAMVEKMLQVLFAPVGIVWMGLFLTFYVSVLSRVKGPAILSLVLWMLLSVCGNSFVSKQLIGVLESEYRDQDFQKMPDFDVVIVLGGGAGTTPAKQAQLGLSGDRIAQVAKLYHMKKVKQVICSGTYSLAPYPGELTQSEAAYRLLVHLQVPFNDILQIDGSNTLEETQAIDRWLAEQPDRTKLKVGIATSAWHLPRAMRLAESVGIDATPIATDFLSSPFKREPGIIVPTAENLMNTQRAIKEIFAGFFGR